MCGIAGILGFKPIDQNLLLTMSSILRHRGPDDEGFMLLDRNLKQEFFRGEDTIKELNNIKHINQAEQGASIAGLLHRRLSIIDLSPHGHQPLEYDNQKLFIVFNGEIYNYRELKSELISRGYSFAGSSDTEVVLAAYKCWGEKCVTHFTGMWAFAILDLNKKILFLSRDRFGIKPLYFILTDKGFAFASEIKALLIEGLAGPELDHEKFTEFLLYGNTSDPSGNLFRSVKTLPEAHNMIVPLNHPHNIELSQYYNLRERTRETDPGENLNIEKFRNMLNESIDLHLRSDVPVGVNLSGGLDSSSITAFMSSKMGTSRFQTFTAAYHQKNVDESAFANKVVQHCGNIDASFTYPTVQDFWKDLDRQIWHHDLPFHSTSMHAQWEVMKLAHSRGIKVLLNGQGSDEMLGGYYPFAGLYLISLLQKSHLKTLSHEYIALKANFTPKINQAILRSMYAWLPTSAKLLARKRFRIGHTFLNESFIQDQKNISPPEFHARNYRDLSLLSIRHGLQQLLRYEDRLSMAFSIESRVPFLDHRLVEYSVSLDPSLKIKDGWTKYILRKSSEPYLPSEVTWRKDKMGFLTPAGEWKSELKQELLNYIESCPCNSFINRTAIVKACNEDLNHATHIAEFWKIIVILKWIEIYKVSM